MGDFNLNWIDKTRRKKQKNMANKFHLTQMIENPTRITRSSKTLLDLIFSNKRERISKTYNLITGLSDHNLTLVARQLSKKRLRNNTPEGKQYISLIPKTHMQHLETGFRETHWENVVKGKNCEQACKDLLDTIKGLLSKYTKNIPRKQRKRTLPWFSTLLLKLLKQRDAALKKSLKSGLDTDRLIYKGLRNKATSELRKARANYFLDIIKQGNKGNSKLLWRTIDQLSGKEHKESVPLHLKINGTLQNDSLIIANSFNDYFINSVLELGGSISASSPSSNLDKSYSISCMNFNLIDEEKINQILSTISNSKAKDIWGIDTFLLKKFKDVLTTPITHIVNKSLEENYFPNALKTAIVTPIFKAGDKQDVTNYRPISILPAISKVIEKTVAEQLVKHLNTKKLMHPMQFGFRANHSTDTACCYFVEHIKANLDKGGVVGAVFLDLRKAFDTVNHTVLLSKLACFQLAPSVLKWIESYLLNRAQCVKINDKASSLKACSMGVPQGSILGPLLFSTYINDLPSVCDGVEILMYADDTVLFTHGKDLGQVANKLTQTLTNVSMWLKNSCLTLNTEKTVTMFFHNRFKLNIIPDIYVDGTKLKNVEEFKYLGVILDSTLSFKKHIKKLGNTVKYSISNFRHIRNSLTVDAAVTYVNAMIMSHLHYCLSSWSQANKTVLRSIDSLYKQALKVLDRRSFQYHHCPILGKYNMLSLENIIRFSDLRLIHKIIHNAAPPPLKTFVQPCSEQMSRTSRSTSRGDCSLPNRRTTFAQSAFSFRATKTWNSLPSDLKCITDYQAFSRAVKKWILTNQSCQH